MIPVYDLTPESNGSGCQINDFLRRFVVRTIK